MRVGEGAEDLRDLLRQRSVSTTEEYEQTEAPRHGGVRGFEFRPGCFF